MSRNFRPFFCLKDSTWTPYEQAKTVSRIFSFSWRYSPAKFENRVSTKSRTTRTHVFPEYEKVRKTIFACSYGAQDEYFKQKMFKKSRDTVPLMQMFTYSNREQIQHGLLYLTQHQMTKIENILFSLYNLRTFYFIYCQEFANTQFLTM